MPEGPSIVILKEEMQQFAGKKILEVSGNSKIGIERLAGQRIIEFRSLGKQFFICFKTFTVRIHMMLYGSYRINEDKDAAPRLSMKFKRGVINFYSCSVKFIEGDINGLYDWSIDIMSDQWQPKVALEKLKADPQALICDALLDQNMFAGVGNIIKNEVLFRVRISPLSVVGAIPIRSLRALVAETRVYCFQFYEWKKAHEFKKHWLAHTKKICPRDNVKLCYGHPGKTHRRAFYCNLCQVLYQ